MPITPFVTDEAAFDPEALRAMCVAFERACRSLGVAGKSDPVTKLVAFEIIDAASKGERDADKLFDAVMQWAARPTRSQPAGQAWP